MNTFAIISAMIGIAVYVPLCIALLQKRVVQNFATWILWTSLDGIVAGSLYVQQGEYLLPSIYMIGSGITCACILRSKEFHWTTFETFTTAMVIGCLVLWKLTEAELATIASTAAVVIASFPAVADAYRKPHEQPLLVFVGFTLSNSFGVAAGSAWTIQERLYPTACVPLSVLLVILSLRRGSPVNA